MREEHDGAHARAAAARDRAHRGRYRASGRRRSAGAAGGRNAQRARPSHRDDLPGAGDQPQSGPHRRPSDRRGARPPPRAARRGGAAPRGGAPRCGRHRRERAPARRVPFSALRRHEAAGDDRARARGRAGSLDCRRADDRARRDHPGAGARAPPRPAAPHRDGDPSHHARPRHRCPDGTPGGGDVRRHDRGSRRPRRVLPGVAAPVFAQALCRASRTAVARRRARRHSRAGAAAHRRIRGVPFRRPLRARLRPVPCRGAGLGRNRRDASGPLSSAQPRAGRGARSPARRGRGGPCPAGDAACAAHAAGPRSALPDPAGAAAANGWTRACRRRRVAGAAPRAHPGPGRRVRLRQDHRRQEHPSARASDCGQRRVRRGGAHPAPRRSAAPAAGRLPDDLPGPVRLAQPAHAGRGHPVRGHARARRARRASHG